MGNHRFKLSDMMPNAWFYKLRDMSKPKTQNPRKLPPPPPPKNPRKSYYHTTDSRKNSPKNPKSVDPRAPWPEPPRKSSKKRAKRKTIYMPSPKQITPDCIFQDPDEDNHNIPVWLEPGDFNSQVYDFQARPDEDFFIDGSEFDSFDEGPNHHHRPVITEELLRSKFSSSATDIIIDVNSLTEKLDMLSEPDLPPVATRPAVKRNNNNDNDNNKNPSSSPGQKKKNATAPKSVSRSGGARVKIYGNQRSRRSNARKKTENGNWKSSSKGEKKGLFGSESCAVVKSSVDPERDFRESMMEMIVENNIRGSKDLEELLACYLSLNSNQYHALIIKAFEQIWFNMPQTHF